MSSDEPDSSSTSNGQRQEKSWLNKLLEGFTAEPKSRDELLTIIKEAADNKLLDQEALNIIEGALDVVDQQVREVMVPRSQIVAIKLGQEPSDCQEAESRTLDRAQCATFKGLSPTCFLDDTLSQSLAPPPRRAGV